jgi:HD-like signal output (HDOD) protein
MHEEAGAALAGRWAVAPVVGEAIARHHAPAGHELAHVVALADTLAHGTDPGPHPAALNLYPDDVEALRRETESIVATVEAAS